VRQKTEEVINEGDRNGGVRKRMQVMQREVKNS